MGHDATNYQKLLNENVTLDELNGIEIIFKKSF